MTTKPRLIVVTALLLAFLTGTALASKSSKARYSAEARPSPTQRSPYGKPVLGAEAACADKNERRRAV